MYQGELHKKSVEGPLFLCVSAENIPKILFEVHNGWCGSHIGGRSLALKIKGTGFFWPTLSKDMIMYVKTCDVCKKQSTIPQKSATTITPVNKGAWIEELLTVLLSLTKTPSHATGETPFALVYGTEVVLPVKVGLPSDRQRGFDEAENSERMKEQLNFTYELRDKALFKMVQYKHLMARCYNTRVKNREFMVGDLVVRMYAIAHPNCKNKLSPKWEGPYKVTKVVGPTTYELSHINGKPINHTWHATKHRKYYV
ncbi:hypothetical protein LIER_03464 [Lithospermum erythrorhizon]|uniref:Integrase zinc-binding domain-containing protein n=1 Tax=Lithospermum erythrorhizon TaxID=34254 RepID=A0AAV3NTE6_LITER